MRAALWAGFICLLASLGGCSHTSSRPGAEWVFEGGKIFTAEPGSPWAEALAVNDGRIVYVGARAGAQAYKGEATQVVDIGEGLLVPGFMDSHNHIFYGSFADVGAVSYTHLTLPTKA